jgi:hypothetical protein
MTHIAMFDAANSVADAYTPFHAKRAVPEGLASSYCQRRFGECHGGAAITQVATNRFETCAPRSMSLAGRAALGSE